MKHLIRFLLGFLLILLASSSVIAQKNWAYQFDGEDDNGYALQTYNVNSEFSVETWVYLIGEQKTPIIYQIDEDTNEDFAVFVENGLAYFRIDGNEVNSGVKIPIFQWVHIAGTYDGTTPKFYLNGKEVTEPGDPSLVPELDGPNAGVYVANSDEGALRGLIDEIRFWNIAIESKHMNASGGNGSPSENFPSSIAEYLIGRWSFSDDDPSNNDQDNTVEDISNYDTTTPNHLTVTYTNIVDSKNIPFLIVNTTGDEADPIPGDGSAVTSNGGVTLRSAIMEANAQTINNLIYFYIPGTGPFLINVAELPAITRTVYMDASFQKNEDGPLITVSGGNYVGLNFTASGNTLTGLALTNFETAVLLSGDENTIENNSFSSNGTAISITSSDNTVTNNEINGSISKGIDVFGTEPLAGNNITNNTFNSNSGFSISSVNSSGLISSNTFADNGVAISVSGGSGNVIGNTGSIGSGISLTDRTGEVSGNTFTINGGFGIEVLGTSDGLVKNNELTASLTDPQTIENGITIVGGTQEVTLNTVTGFGGSGLLISGGSGAVTNNNIQTNNIGISLSANGRTLSGNNVHSNLSHGFLVQGNNNVLTSNIIGSDESVEGSAGNGGDGILVQGLSTSNVIGGVDLVDGVEVSLGNTVSGNTGNGISINNGETLSGNTLSNNIISENTGHGVEISGDYNDLEGNHIFGNDLNGVFVLEGNYNTIFNKNLIYNNTDVNSGIILNENANGDIKAPVLKIFYNSTANDNSIVIGGLGNTPNAEYSIEFFKVPSSGEIQEYLGYASFISDGGNSDLVLEWPIVDQADNELFPNLVAAKDEVIATLTDAAGNTSEFSEVRTVYADAGLHFKVNTTSSASGSIPLHWPDGNATFTISRSVLNMNTEVNDYENSIVEGFKNWSDFDFGTAEPLLSYNRNVDNVNNIIIDETNKWGGDPDGINNVVWIDEADWGNANKPDYKDLPPQAAAVTRVRYNSITGEFFDVDIAFNAVPISSKGTRFSWKISSTTDELPLDDDYDLDVENVATHEIGHFSGLADLYEPGDPGYIAEIMGVGNADQTMYGRVGNETTKRSLFDYRATEKHNHNADWENTEINRS